MEQGMTLKLSSEHVISGVDDSVGKELATQAKDLNSIPRTQKKPGQ